MQKTITLTDDQLQYIRENYKTMSQPEMARRMKTTVHRVANHMKILGIARILRKHKAATVIVMEGYFDEREYKKTLIYQ